MRKPFAALLALAFVVILAAPVRADSTRDEIRERVRTTLASYGPSDAGITFHQSEKQPYNFSGELTAGLKNASAFEVVVSVSDKQTIAFRAYPHYNGGYINLNRVVKSGPFMRQILKMNDTNFMFWGADDTSDVFAGYEFTLESGYPEAAIRIVLQSIPLLDQFVGAMRPNVDGTKAK